MRRWVCVRAGGGVNGVMEAMCCIIYRTVRFGGLTQGLHKRGGHLPHTIQPLLHPACRDRKGRPRATVCARGP